MLACTALVGCTNDDDVLNSNESVANKEGEAYMTVKFTMPGNTNVSSRAFQDDKFAEGTEAETKVNNAWFFFLNDAQQGCADPFELDMTGSKYIWTDVQGDNDDTSINNSTSSSIEEKSNPIVVIRNPISTPKYIACVLNWENTFSEGYKPSLAELQAVVSNFSSSTSAGSFVMSSSVYIDGDKLIAGGIVGTKNIYKDKDKLLGDIADEKATPVKIPVERVLAKVFMNNAITDGTSVTDESNVLKDETGAATNNKKYEITATVTGWWLDYTNPSSYLVKNLNSTYPDFLNNWWNDKTNTRSYWAESAVPTAYTHYTWNEATATTGQSLYCQENTSSTTTKLAVKVILKNNGTATTLVRWAGELYTQTDFFNLVAGAYQSYRILKTKTEGTTTKSDYYPLTGDAAQGVTGILGWEYNTSTNNLGIKDYEGLITVSNVGEGYQLVKVAVEGDEITVTGQVSADDVQKDIRKTISAVPLWLEGRAYYYTDIIHNNNTAEDGKEVNSTLYGIVRNHLYSLKLNSITGLGTPAPGTDTKIETEKLPDDEESYISAEVQIASFKVVPEQNVALGSN